MDWKLLISVAGLLWGIGLAVWTRYVASQSATKEEIRRLQEEQAELEVRLARTETRLEQVPGAEAVHKIEVAVSALEGDLKKISATVEPIARSTRRIEDYLLNERRGK